MGTVRRAVVSTTTYAVDSATITGINICNSGVLVLPPSTYVCGVFVENYNVVRGAEMLTAWSVYRGGPAEAGEAGGGPAVGPAEIWLGRTALPSRR